MFTAFLKNTGFERVTGEGEVYKSSAVSRPLLTNGTLGDAVAFCDLTDFTDPFKPLRATVGPDGCPETTAEAFPVQRLLAFPPQFDIEDVGIDLARRALARPDALTLTLTLAPRVSDPGRSSRGGASPGLGDGFAARAGSQLEHYHDWLLRDEQAESTGLYHL